MKSFWRSIVLIFMFFYAIFLPSGYAEVSPTEIDNYISMIKSDSPASKQEAAQIVFNSVIFDEGLYKAINEEVLKCYKLNPDDKTYANAMAWLCKALAVSGENKYRATLEEVSENAPNKKLKKYALSSIEILKSSIIERADNPDLPEDLSPEARRYCNMITSDDDGLVTKAASEIFKSDITEEYLYETINTVLLKGYGSGNDDDSHVDAMSWLCKALASSGKEEYRSTLEEVASNAQDKKLRNYARTSLNDILLFEPAPAPNENESIVVVYRNGMYLRWRSVDILLDRSKPVTLKNKSYTYFRTAPGDHVLEAEWPESLNSQSLPLEISLEPGKIYYVKLEPHVDLYRNDQKKDSDNEVLDIVIRDPETSAGMKGVAVAVDEMSGIQSVYSSAFAPPVQRCPSFMYKLKYIDSEI